MFLPNAVLRVTQLIFTTIVLGLAGALVAQTVFGGSNSRVNYAVFVGAFSMLSLFYFFFALFKEGAAHPLVLSVLDGLNVLFTLAAGIALAQKLHVHSCGNTAYVVTNSITNGSRNPTKSCHEAQALTAFIWFLFGTYLATVILSLLASRRATGSSRGAAPAMAQV